jgi:hypothetical protein
MKSFILGALVVVSVFSTGCASIVSKSKYPVSIITEPAAAKIEVKDQDGIVRFSGVSPTTAILDSGNGYFTRARYTVTAAKDGYTPATLQLQNSMDGWYWGNIVLGGFGLIGFFLVDPITGAMFQIDSPVANMSLAPAVTEVSYGGERLRKLKELRNTGVLTEIEYQSKKRAIVKDL